MRCGDHSSRPQLALRLQQPTRGLLSASYVALRQFSTRTEQRPLSRTLSRRAGPALPSYLALHHAGFSVPPVSPPERWALTPPFHPCQAVRRCRACAQRWRRRLTGFPAPHHRAALHRRSILCGTFRDAAGPAGFPTVSTLSPDVIRRVALYPDAAVRRRKVFVTGSCEPTTTVSGLSSRSTRVAAPFGTASRSSQRSPGSPATFIITYDAAAPLAFPNRLLLAASQ